MAGKNFKIVVICGPTSTGKSELAVKIAKRFNGEVISADSRQVYKGLDIATGKITKKEMRGVPHHLLDVASPKIRFDANRYAKLARLAIKDIARRGKLPIICGGTGFYISAALGEIALANVPPNKALRKKLNGKTAEQLYKILKKLAPERVKIIDRHNPVRLIRAIEIVLAISKPISDRPLQRAALRYEGPPFVILKIGLDLPNEELKKRIHLRTLARLKKGMTNEARHLHKQGLSYHRMSELGMEYKSLAKYLNNKITKEQLIKEIETDNWHYAKRQRVWFKRDKGIRWFESKENSIQKAVTNFIK